MLPLGGAKGAGLSFMIECLTSLLLSHPRIAPDLESWAIGDDPFLNGTVIAIDIGGFGDPTFPPRPSGSAPRSPASPAPTASTRSCCPASAATRSAPSARLGHSHPEGHVATYRQGRAGGRRHAADVRGRIE